MQWPKEKGQKNKQRSTKHTHKTKDRATPTPLKTGGEHMFRKGKIFLLHMCGSSRVTLVTNPVIGHE
jgi:hypothetical protein